MKMYSELQTNELLRTLTDITQWNEQLSDDWGDVSNRALDAIRNFQQVKSIELPSDEEIEDKGKWVFNDAGHTIYTHYNTVPSWVAGAKWMKEQITKTK